jgi:hypothetical protein
MYIYSETKLLRACQVLFGPEVQVTREFLYYIQPSGIKSAYRKKALITHPDRATHLGKGAHTKTVESFIETNRAYRQLLEFIHRRDNGARVYVTAAGRPRPKARPMRAGHEEPPQQRGNFYRGSIPSRKLPLGQFLFYSGEIPWEALIKAIVWQRNQRPRLGDIARQWGWLVEQDVLYALRRRTLGEPIGETLVRHGLLSRAQLDAIIKRQRQMQRPFGEYFVLNRHITRSRLNRLLRDFKWHNSRTGLRRGQYGDI